MHSDVIIIIGRQKGDDAQQRISKPFLSCQKVKTLSFEGSVNTTCSVDLRLIDARFVNYNSQALPPLSVYSLCA